MNPIEESIFREYDIRGLVDSQLQDDVVERIASAFATVFLREQKKKIAVGMDGRPSSKRIKDIVVSTLARYGLNILDIGLVPTPVLYYAVFQLNLGGGIIITASHNPPEYNGFKALVGKEAQSGAQIREIYDIASSQNFPAQKYGSVESLDIISDYLQTILRDIRLEKKI
jgi:phosphomannomutase/phosphoglucomutase